MLVAAFAHGQGKVRFFFRWCHIGHGSNILLGTVLAIVFTIEYLGEKKRTLVARTHSAVVLETAFAHGQGEVRFLFF
jgi:hypothetical protein